MSDRNYLFSTLLKMHNVNIKTFKALLIIYTVICIFEIIFIFCFSWIIVKFKIIKSIFINNTSKFMFQFFTRMNVLMHINRKIARDLCITNDKPNI